MDFEKLLLKTYENWDLYLHQNQSPYIGRAYAWVKRDEAKELSDMNKNERNELYDLIIPEWENAVKKQFQHDWTNIACFGNTSPHLHYHLIPRYHSKKEFFNQEFFDENPQGNYAPYKKIDLEEELLMKIKYLLLSSI